MTFSRPTRAVSTTQGSTKVRPLAHFSNTRRYSAVASTCLSCDFSSCSDVASAGRDGRVGTSNKRTQMVGYIDHSIGRTHRTYAFGNNMWTKHTRGGMEAPARQHRERGNIYSGSLETREVFTSDKQSQFELALVSSTKRKHENYRRT